MERASSRSLAVEGSIVNTISFVRSNLLALSDAGMTN